MKDSTLSRTLESTSSNTPYTTVRDTSASTFRHSLHTNLDLCLLFGPQSLISVIPQLDRRRALFSVQKRRKRTMLCFSGSLLMFLLLPGFHLSPLRWPFVMRFPGFRIRRLVDIHALLILAPFFTHVRTGKHTWVFNPSRDESCASESSRSGSIVPP